MVEKARDNLLEHMMSLDKGSMDMPTLKLYAETLKIVSEVLLKSYYETMTEMLYTTGTGRGFSFRGEA